MQPAILLQSEENTLVQVVLQLTGAFDAVSFAQERKDVPVAPNDVARRPAAARDKASG